MEIIKRSEGSKLTITLTGKLDTITSKQFEEELKSSFEGITEMILDLNGLTYITSAGLRVLAIVQKTMKRQGRLIIRDPQPDVQEVFDMTGLSSFMEIEHSGK